MSILLPISLCHFYWLTYLVSCCSRLHASSAANCDILSRKEKPTLFAPMYRCFVPNVYCLSLITISYWKCDVVLTLLTVIWLALFTSHSEASTFFVRLESFDNYINSYYIPFQVCKVLPNYSLPSLASSLQLYFVLLLLARASRKVARHGYAWSLTFDWLVTKGREKIYTLPNPQVPNIAKFICS